MIFYRFDAILSLLVVTLLLVQQVPAHRIHPRHKGSPYMDTVPSISHATFYTRFAYLVLYSF